ncbi:hypothetical protein BH10BDE1_BH10BDE1_29750 [soil metagenome]
MSESQNDQKNSTSNTNSVKDAQAERAIRKSNISLAEQRRSGRVLGFVGLSTFGHVAILVALAAVPMAVHEMNSGDNKPAGAGEVSMIDVSGTSASVTAGALTAPKENSTVEVSVMTDAASDIAMSPTAKTEIKPEVKKPMPVEAAVVPLPAKKVAVEKALPAKKQPAQKAVVKATPKAPRATEQAQVVAPEIMTEEAQEAPPVLLANPPSDDEPQAERQERPAEIAQAVAAPAVEAAPVEEEKPERIAEKTPEKPADKPADKPVAAFLPTPKKVETKPEPVEEPAQTVADEPKEEVVAAAPVAASKSSAAESDDSANDGATNEKQGDPTAAAGESSKSSMAATNTTGNRSGQGDKGQGGTVGAMTGPIRDASELKALNGNPNPVYPPRDRLAHKEGTAVILGRVSPDGRVVEATIEKSSGSQNMDNASIQAFRGWRFQAGQQGWVRKPFQFRLVGEAKEIAAPLGKGLKR